MNPTPCPGKSTPDASSELASSSYGKASGFFFSSSGTGSGKTLALGGKPGKSRRIRPKTLSKRLLEHSGPTDRRQIQPCRSQSFRRTVALRTIELAVSGPGAPFREGTRFPGKDRFLRPYEILPLVPKNLRRSLRSRFRAHPRQAGGQVVNPELPRSPERNRGPGPVFGTTAAAAKTRGRKVGGA